MSFYSGHLAFSGVAKSCLFWEIYEVPEYILMAKCWVCSCA